MSTKFPSLGIQWRHFPEGVPLPPVSIQTALKGDKKGKKAKKNALQSLSQLQIGFLYTAIRNPEYPLHFQIYQGDASGKLRCVTHSLLVPFSDHRFIRHRG